MSSEAEPRMRKILPPILLAALTLAACDEPAPYRGPPQGSAAPAVLPAMALPAGAKAVGAETVRPQPIRWNEAEQRFELNGAPLRAEKLWTFDGSTDGFTMTGGEATLAKGPGLWVANQSGDPILRTPSALNVDGSVNTLVLVRVTRATAGGAWSGDLHYVTAAHGESAEFVALPVSGANPAVNETTILVYDMSRLRKGGADWTQSLIQQVRLDFEDQAGGEFLVRQVAITRNPNPAALGG